MAILAGDLRWRLRLERRALDANGDRTGDWGALTTVAAKITVLRGSDPVLEQRLQGIQPVVISIRASTVTRRLTTADRAVNTRSGEVYLITAVTPDVIGDQVDLLAHIKEQASG